LHCGVSGRRVSIRVLTYMRHGDATDRTYGSRSGGVTQEEIMALLTEAARGRLVTYEKNTCPQCSAWLLAPDWSEHLSERRVRHNWSCETCGYGFETTVFFPALQNAAA
jgi:ribosomal protein S27AE